MRNDHAPIVDVRLRVTDDPRTGIAAAAWAKLARKLAATRAQLDEQAGVAPVPVPDIYFGSAAK